MSSMHISWFEVFWDKDDAESSVRDSNLFRSHSKVFFFFFSGKLSVPSNNFEFSLGKPKIENLQAEKKHRRIFVLSE